jgi:hypothetical protein
MNLFNLIDTNLLINKLQFIINNFDSLDDQYKLILISILILLISIIYIISFILAPSIFNAIKDILPIRVQTFLIKLININRKISVPFVILSSIMVIFSLLLVIFFLSTGTLRVPVTLESILIVNE